MVVPVVGTNSPNKLNVLILDGNDTNSNLEVPALYFNNVLFAKLVTSTSIKDIIVFGALSPAGPCGPVLPVNP